MKKFNSCEGCGGSCCKDIVMNVSYLELLHLLNGNSVVYDELEDGSYFQITKENITETTISQIFEELSKTNTLYAENYRRDFLIKGNCGYLNHGSVCSAYEKRPMVCKIFPRNSKKCIALRDMRGNEIEK